MKLFAQIVRTAVNIAILPVKLPIAVVKDSLDCMQGHSAENTTDLIKEIKEEAEEKDPQ